MVRIKGTRKSKRNYSGMQLCPNPSDTMDVHPEVRPITWETTALATSPIIAFHCTQPTHLKTGSTDIIASS